MLMSMAACPSIDPASPRSACCRAASMSLRRTNSRNATATSTIMIGPPTNSARVNCQDSSSAMMMPSAMTSVVLAISKVIAAVKLAPRRNSARASATAAYEHDDEAAPNPVASASAFGPSSPSSRATVCRRITAWTTADSVNPRISDQVISHVIEPATARAWPIASSPRIVALRGGDGEQLAQAVLEQRVREAVGQPVEHHPAVFAEADHPGQPQHLQRVGDLILGGLQGQRQVAHAQFPGRGQREQDPRADRIGQHPQQPRQPPGLARRQDPGPRRRHPLRANRMLMIEPRHPHLRTSTRISGNTNPSDRIPLPPSPGQFVEAVERVVHLDVPDLCEAGLGGQVAEHWLGQPEGTQAFAALGEGCGHAVQDREAVQQGGDGTGVGCGLAGGTYAWREAAPA